MYSIAVLRSFLEINFARIRSIRDDGDQEDGFGIPTGDLTPDAFHLWGRM
ncbi:hypothetical protein DsansV1_C07g0073761 [Dioscorea sansibarensis]